MQTTACRRLFPLAIAMSVALALGACGRVDDALDEAGRRITSEDVTLNADGQPRARITTDGDLVIDGSRVEVDDDQRRLLLAYRGQMVAVSSRGVEIGRRGAALGVSAARDAVADAFSGKGDAVGDRIRAQAEELKQEALAICDDLQGLKQAQDELAAALPEFRPYAGLEQSDVDDCRKRD